MEIRHNRPNPVFGDAFEIDVLEVLKKKETGSFNEKEELRKLDEKWFDQVQPNGENGYHTRK
ncbi:hypothetical protein [Bacillus sp. OV166]|uniref:hypothetical protein n=1 Tax=Bacillus sp. OV166 TaxID=1882763 RepID=UPI000B44DB5F|nr:hypothetical protein [Bacillus sp. OV166]